MYSVHLAAQGCKFSSTSAGLSDMNVKALCKGIRRIHLTYLPDVICTAQPSLNQSHFLPILLIAQIFVNLLFFRSKSGLTESIVTLKMMLCTSGVFPKFHIATNNGNFRQ